MTATLLAEWGGAALGMLGSAVLASHAPWARRGWLIWIVSNLLLIVYTITIASWGLLAMQAFYMATSVMGAWRAYRGAVSRDGGLEEA